MPSTPLTMEKLWQRIEEKMDNDQQKNDKKQEKWYEEMKNIKIATAKLNEKVGTVEKSLIKTKSDVIELQTSVNRLEQLPLNPQLVIRGIPEKNDEQVKAIVQEVFKVVGGNIQSKILGAYRLGIRSPGKSRSILVKLASAEQKNQILSEKRKKSLACSEVTVNGSKIGSEDEFIFFGEHLTAMNSKLFFIGRNLVKKKEIFRCYTRGGLVYVRKNEEAASVPIRHETDFVCILKEEGPTGKENDEVNSTSREDSVNQSLQVLTEVVDKANKSMSNMFGRNTRSTAKKVSNSDASKKATSSQVK